MARRLSARPQPRLRREVESPQQPQTDAHSSEELNMTRKEWRHLVVFYKNHEYVPDFAGKYKERLIALHYQRPDYMLTMKFTRRLKWYSIYEAIVTNTRSTTNSIFR